MDTPFERIILVVLDSVGIGAMPDAADYGDAGRDTADHGCDPQGPSTDHSREYVPVLAAGPQVRGGTDLGTRATLADIGVTIAENFGLHLPRGTTFLAEITP
jgi:phosphopentomutase